MKFYKVRAEKKEMDLGALIPFMSYWSLYRDLPFFIPGHNELSFGFFMPAKLHSMTEPFLYQNT